MALTGSQLKDYLLGLSDNFTDAGAVTFAISTLRVDVKFTEGATEKSKSVDITVTPGSALETALLKAIEAAVKA